MDELDAKFEEVLEIGKLLFTYDRNVLTVTHIRPKAYCLDYLKLKCELINVLMP